MGRAAALLVTACVVVAACGGAEATTRPGFRRLPAPEIGDVVVLDHAGAPAVAREVGLRADPGELLVLYLGYLSCPDVCPLTLSDLARAYQELEPGSVQRLSTALLTVDPGRDTGAEIDAYLSNFFDRYRALRAPDDATLDVVLDRLAATVELEEHDPGDENYLVAHSAVTYVVDDSGAVVWELPFGTSDTDIATAIDDLLREIEP